ncbi:hypothetical protein Ciccas_000367 [Cichlidogyrus casuarinus]|uniref:EB domain-containing protein n=1 Tax=Cichlidogyrus casuarinus TaxID=1844966 RepID=A0ABD2QNH9_9PLAT
MLWCTLRVVPRLNSCTTLPQASKFSVSFLYNPLPSIPDVPELIPLGRQESGLCDAKHTCPTAWIQRLLGCDSLTRACLCERGFRLVQGVCVGTISEQIYLSIYLPFKAALIQTSALPPNVFHAPTFISIDSLYVTAKNLADYLSTRNKIEISIINQSNLKQVLGNQIYSKK